MPEEVWARCFWLSMPSWIGRWRSKELQAYHAHDPQSQSRFLREARVTGRLEHPGIVPVYGLGRHADGRPYYAMRFIEGETLKQAIERFHGTQVRRTGNRRAGARRSGGCCAASSTPATRSLTRTAAGVVHRDLKPENIMLGTIWRDAGR